MTLCIAADSDIRNLQQHRARQQPQFGPVLFKVALEAPDGKTDVYANYSSVGVTLNTVSGGSGASLIGSTTAGFIDGIATAPAAHHQR